MENSLALTGLFDDATAVKVGEALNAGAVITGTLTKLAQDFVLHIRAVDCFSKMMIPGTAFKGRIKAAKDTKYLFSRQTGLTISVYFLSDSTGNIFIDKRFSGTVSFKNNILKLSPGMHTVKVIA